MEKKRVLPVEYGVSFLSDLLVGPQESYAHIRVVVSVSSIYGLEEFGYRLVGWTYTFFVRFKRAPEACTHRADSSRSLIGFSESLHGTLRGFVVVGVHIQYVYIVLGDECVSINQISHFSR